MTDAASMLASPTASVRKEREGQGREENQITIFASLASFTDKLPSRAISNG